MLPWYRAYVFWIRLSNKLIFKKKKKFVARGMIVSITGVDGSGKSTVVKELQKVFSSFMSCSLLTLGKPQGPILERARKFVRRDKARNNSSTSRQIQNSSTVANVTACVLAFLRLRTAKKAVRRASKGELVITDRWPTNDRYKMDGPKIISDSSLGTVQAFLSRFEKYLYNKIPSSDVCIVLGVDTDTAVSRNNLRIKEEKETEEEILDRHRVNHHFRPIAHTVLHFDNSASLDLAFPEVLQLVWSKIVESEQSRVVK